MKQEIYAIKDQQLIIQDSELGLDWILPFSLPMLPSNLMHDQTLHQGCLLVVERDEEKLLRAAFLTCDGKKHGQCRLFYSNGSIEADLYYQRDLLHGPSIFYSEQGEVLSKTFFCEGKREGKVYFYDPTGAVVSIQRFRSGKSNGLQEYFYIDGSIKSQLPYQEGCLHGQVVLYWENRSLKRKTDYYQGLRNGKDQLWNEVGLLIDEAHYAEGLPQGVQRQWFHSGKIREEISYHTALRYDRVQWDEKGTVLLEGIWTADQYIEKTRLEGQGMSVRKGYWDGHRLCWK